jgi:hypothetical protein
MSNASGLKRLALEHLLESSGNADLCRLANDKPAKRKGGFDTANDD